MKRKKVIICGSLRRFLNGFPAEFEVETETGSAAEAIKAFSLMCKGLRPTPGRPRPRIRAVGFDDVADLFLPTDKTEIRLVLDFCGGKKGGFIQIILGVALVAASFIPGLNVALVGGVTLSGLLFSFGATLVLGGLVNFLSKAPKRDSSLFEKDPEASKYLGAPKNTVAIGTRRPICYGRNKIFGHYIHFDIDAVNVPT
jgi:predicted phage tail protein